MSHFGIAIDQATNDIYIDTTNNLAVARDAKAIGEHGRQRIKAFRGEWFLDRTAGMSWLTDILGKRYDPTLAEAIVKAEILDTAGVVSITGFSIGFAQEQRRLDIGEVTVTTQYDVEVTL